MQVIEPCYHFSWGRDLLFPGIELVSVDGKVSKKRLSSSSFRFRWMPPFSSSREVRAANCEGAWRMWGVKKISSSVLESFFVLRLKRFPKKGMSPRNGILFSETALESCISPPIITVWLSGVTTTVSAERELIKGALTVPELPLEIGPH